MRRTLPAQGPLSQPDSVPTNRAVQPIPAASRLSTDQKSDFQSSRSARSSLATWTPCSGLRGGIDDPWRISSLVVSRPYRLSRPPPRPDSTAGTSAFPSRARPAAEAAFNRTVVGMTHRRRHCLHRRLIPRHIESWVCPSDTRRGSLSLSLRTQKRSWACIAAGRWVERHLRRWCPGRIRRHIVAVCVYRNFIIMIT